MTTIANFDLCTEGTFNTNTGELVIVTDDFVTYPPIVYSFTIKGQVSEAPTSSQEISFQIKFVKPCPTAVLTTTT